jgi:LemA protein
MSGFFSFIGTLLQVAVFIVIVLGVIALFGYNALRHLSEAIKEAWSNIGVTAKKQVSLINQLIEVVKGYQESEKFVMLKVSDDVSSAAGVAQLYQQSGAVMSSISGMAQKFPELKANDQYQRLIDSIQACEGQLENVRQSYNSAVKVYNSKRSSIPHVFYATTLGFRVAPYLEFSGNEISADVGAMQSFTSGADGDRLNALLSSAGSSALKLGGKAFNSGANMASKALEGGKVLAEAAQDKARIAIESHQAKAQAAELEKSDGESKEITKTEKAADVQ